MEALGTLLNAPGLLWGTIWGAWGEHVDHFEEIFASQGGVRHENSRKLEFDDSLNVLSDIPIHKAIRTSKVQTLQDIYYKKDAMISWKN